MSDTEDVRKPSHRLTFDDAVQVWLMLCRCKFKNRIAAHFDVNIARIYELKSGKLHPGSEITARMMLAKENAA